MKENDNRISILDAAEQVRRRMNLQGDDLTDKDVLSLCEEEVLKICRGSSFSVSEKRSAVRLVFCTLRRELEILQDLADDPSVSEIMVNGCENIFYETPGGICQSDLRFETRQQLERIIQRLAAATGRELNDLNPIVDARLSDGSRVNAVNSNIALDGPVLTIRKFTCNRLTMDDLVARGSISREAAEFLQMLVEARCNIMVGGGTSSGKTTFLNVLSDFIPSRERVIVIEDSAELQIRNSPNLVRMESKAANAQGKGGVSIRDLIKTSLRMRPDRIIVGEVRGPEVIDMLSAMSTGHDGSLSTGHANSALGMIRRLESLYISGINIPLDAVRGQIADAIEILVHLQRDRWGNRRVTEISELSDYSDGQIILNPLFKISPADELVSTGNRLRRREKLELYYKDDDRLQKI